MTKTDLDTVSYVNVGPDGTFRKSGNYSSTPAGIDDLFVRIEAESKKKLVLYFHGGLVPEDQGMVTVQNIHGVLTNSCHPIGFVWETGFAETIKYRINQIGQNRLFNKMLQYVLQTTGSRLGVAGGSKGVATMSAEEISQELAREDPFSDFITGAKGIGNLHLLDDDTLQEDLRASMEAKVQEDFELREILVEEVAESKLLDKDKVADTPAKGAKGIIATGKLIKALAAVAFRVVKRHVKKTDHGFYPTIVEEVLREFYLADFGAWVWGGMKQKAENMWNPNDNRQGEELYAGSYFLQKLSEWQVGHPEATIDLIGHSAGSIAICHLLRVVASRHPEMKFRNIVFLAPACTVDLFCREIMGRTSRFERFRMFTMDDEYERKDRLVSGLYTRSLLYFISGVLEGTDDQLLVGLHRHITGLDPYDKGSAMEASRFLLLENENRTVFSVTKPVALEGLQCNSASHGFFDDDPHTHKSLLYLLK